MSCANKLRLWACHIISLNSLGQAEVTPPQILVFLLPFVPFYGARHLVLKALLSMGTSFQLTTGNNLINHRFTITHRGGGYSHFCNTSQSSLPSDQPDRAQVHVFTHPRCKRTWQSWFLASTLERWDFQEQCSEMPDIHKTRQISPIGSIFNF